MVPDVVEELVIAPDLTRLERDELRMISSESDDHALEEALLLKERYGGRVTVLIPEAAEADATLYSAAAKGADRLIKLSGLEAAFGTHALAMACAAALRSIPDLLPADLILTGAQAIEDLDGLMAPLVAHQLGWPYLGIITKVDELKDGTVTVVKEFPGGFRGEFQMSLPAVLGIQAAEKPPRYVPVAKVRAAMKSARIEEAEAPEPASAAPQIEVLELAKPVAAGQAQMLEGSPEQVAEQLCQLLAERALL